MIIDRNKVSTEVFDKLDALCNCVSTDTTRLMLNYVKLHVEKGLRFLVATDGRCLGIFDITHTSIPELAAIKRCRMYRVLNAGRSKIILDDCTASCNITFPNWQRVNPDMSEYSIGAVLDEKTNSLRYAHLLYSLCTNKKMPISLDLFEKMKRLKGDCFDEKQCRPNRESTEQCALHLLWLSETT